MAGDSVRECNPSGRGFRNRECDPSGEGDCVGMRPKVAGLTWEGTKPKWRGGTKEGHTRGGGGMCVKKEKEGDRRVMRKLGERTVL